VFVDLFCAAVAVASLLLLLGFLATIRFRILESPEKAFQKLHPHQVTLLPYVAEDESSPARDDQLWRAIGGMRGLFQLPRDAFALLALCASLDYTTKDPEEYQINLKRVETIAMSTLLAACEAMFRRLVPWMPRPYLRLIAAEYWRMCLSLQTLVSVHSPEMIERVAEVL
jgi:hypothetical protein